MIEPARQIGANDSPDRSVIPTKATQNKWL
jgi:hypothetical protein